MNEQIIDPFYGKHKTHVKNSSKQLNSSPQCSWLLLQQSRECGGLYLWSSIAHLKYKQFEIAINTTSC